MIKRRTDNTMIKRRTENTMIKRRTDTTMIKRRTDNTMIKRKRTMNQETLHRKQKISNVFLIYNYKLKDEL